MVRSGDDMLMISETAAALELALEARVGVPLRGVVEVELGGLGEASKRPRRGERRGD